jgi:hypothetical protein
MEASNNYIEIFYQRIFYTEFFYFLVVKKLDPDPNSLASLGLNPDSMNTVGTDPYWSSK